MAARARRALLAITFSIVALSATTATAREPTAAEIAQARDLFARAERDERTGDWKGAIDKLQRAGAVKMTPGIRFHIALCQENLGKLVEALASYEAAAQQARADNVKDVLESSQEPLADLRARVPSLTLSLVNATADDVEIVVDDHPIAATELGAPLRLAVGSHRIIARRRSDGRSFNKELVLRERETIALDLRLPSADTPPRDSAPVGGTGGGPALVPPPEEPKASAGPTRTGAILTTGGAVLFAGAGVGAFLAAGAAQDDLRGCASLAACEDVQTKVRAWDAVALGGFVGAAAAGVVAAVLWLTPGRDRTAKKWPPFGLRAGPGGASVRGAF